MERKWDGHALLMGGKRFELRATDEELRGAGRQLWLHHEIWLTLQESVESFRGGHATYKHAFQTLRDIFTEQAEALHELVAVMAGIDSFFDPPGPVALVPKPNRPDFAKALIDEALQAVEKACPTCPPEPPEDPIPAKE